MRLNQDYSIDLVVLDKKILFMFSPFLATRA